MGSHSSASGESRFKDSSYWKLFKVAGPIVILDQITKAVVLKTLPLYHSVPVVPGLFNLIHIQNPGGAFGFLSGQSTPVRNAVFLVITAIATGIVFYLYRNIPRTHPWLAAGFAMIFGGAVGNLIDRFRFGRVVDFLDVYLGDLHWPAFNVADSAITIGVGIFIGHLLFKKMPE